ncbi:MAG TPA: hypothetical protein VIV66_08560 [Pyrinomonadaceae bacterium]
MATFECEYGGLTEPQARQKVAGVKHEAQRSAKPFGRIAQPGTDAV